MARSLRLSFEDAVYHVTARGHRRDRIFYEDNDKLRFLAKMDEVYEKYGFIYYTYCLMDSHYHIFLKTPRPNISQGMHHLNTSYANWFKAKHGVVGSLFQGRFKAVLVDADSYALTLSAYVHLNPVRAGMARKPEEYQWNSYAAYLGLCTPMVKGLDRSFILAQFGDVSGEASARYREFVEERYEMKSPLEEVQKGFVLGGDLFLARMIERLQNRGVDREIGETKQLKRVTAEKIIAVVGAEFGVREEEILRRGWKNNYRKMALYVMKQKSELTLKQIGELFGMDYTAVSQSVRRFCARLEEDAALRQETDQIIARLALEMSNVKTRPLVPPLFGKQRDV